jgi:hypothetical protein
MAMGGAALEAMVWTRRRAEEGSPRGWEVDGTETGTEGGTAARVIRPEASTSISFSPPSLSRNDKHQQ